MNDGIKIIRTKGAAVGRAKSEDRERKEWDQAKIERRLKKRYEAGRLTTSDKSVLNKAQKKALGKAVLKADLRGLVQGIPAPGAEVEVIRSTKLLVTVVYRSAFGEKYFNLHPDSLG